MKISIVIPAHNEEADIADAIRAALAQDYGDLEVVVVNNASSDRTEGVARSFETPEGRVKVVNEARKGLLWAREAGRLAASGDIIYNMDADCRPDTSLLKRAVRYFYYEEVSGVTGPYDYYDAGWMFASFMRHGQGYLYWLVSAVLQHPRVSRGAVLIGGNTFIRADALRKAGGYNTSLTFYGEDTDTAKRIAKYGRVVFDRKLSVMTSARRLKSEGAIKTIARYWYHFFKHILAKG